MSLSRRLLAWDGLNLRAPADLEPVRLGRGYMLLENESGPRLELRWQPVGKRFSLDRALNRARLARDDGPAPVVRQALSLLSDPGRAVACSPARDSGRHSLLMLLPAGRLAVVAGFFPDPRGAGEQNPDHPSASAQTLARAVASLDDSRPEAVSLYDIALRAPEAMALTEFSFELGRFRLLYQGKATTLEFARFAPAEVILAGKRLADWAGRALSSWAGRGQSWRGTDFNGGEAAGLCPKPGHLDRSLFSRLGARLSPGPKPAQALAWMGDASRILAVRQTGRLNPEAFEAICRDYVVSSNPT